MKKWYLSILSALIISAFLFRPAEAASTYSLKIPVTFYQSEARKMLKLVNKFRSAKRNRWYYNQSGRKVRVKPGKLKYDYKLEKVAMQRAAELAVRLSHTRPNGKAHKSLKPSSYKFMQENFIYVIMSPYNPLIIGKHEEVTAKSFVNTFKEENEPYSGQAHRRNMLNPEHASMGCAVAVVGNAVLVVQEFGNRLVGRKKTSAVDKLRKVKVTAKKNLFRLSKSDASAVPYFCSVNVAGSVKLPSAYGGLGLKDFAYNLPVIPSTVSWEISDPTVAKISGDKIVGLTEGNTVLTATVRFLGMTKKTQVNVIVR